ncbi:MAG: helix-turn-helix domain-containing protein [Candidatus Gastranaerophilales bacterium]|nr:helix-turn-helix domain-containing protein [Candidatus Gastranaerophilales bacterium]
MSEYLLISDTAKKVKVESHVLRYWEEELQLPIKRNELGHRYYTEEDVERFKQIKGMKERGLQLKAIKMILKDGKLDVLSQADAPAKEHEEKPHMAIDIVDNRTASQELVSEDREEKSKRLQWLLQQLIRETLIENNQELCREIRESVVKELDYQFRAREEKEEERDRRQEQRSEEYYKKMDELLRSKSASRKLKRLQKKGEKKKTEEKNSILEKANPAPKTINMKNHKKKRHFIF